MPRTSGIGSSLLRISTVDFFPMAACMFRMCSIRYQFPNKRRKWLISSDFLVVLQQHVLVWVIFELLNQSSNFFFLMCFNLFNSGMWNARDSKNQHNGHCHRCPCADELHSHCHRIFSILKQVHFLNVWRVWHTCVSRYLGDCIFCSKVPPSFLCKPLSRYKSLVVCLKEQFHAIEFDRIAIPFSEQAFNCTKILYCDVRFWVYPDRIQVEYPSGSLP